MTTDQVIQFMLRPDVWTILNITGVLVCLSEIIKICWRAKKTNKITMLVGLKVILLCCIILFIELVVDNHMEPYVKDWIATSPLLREILDEAVVFGSILSAP